MPYWKFVTRIFVSILFAGIACRAQFYWDENDEYKVLSSGYFFKHGPFIYKVVLEKHDKRTWVEAEKICQEEENGHLLTLGDPQESAWFNRLVTNLTDEMDYLGRLWLGATDKRLSGVYEYIDGSPFKYKEAPWAKGEPNRPKEDQYNYCIVVDTKGSSPTWKDEDCFESFGYVCKSKDAPRRLRAVQRFGYSWEWNYYDYKFVILPDDSMTWSEAEIYCQEAESGHLLSIYNSQESDWVTERIRQIRQVLGFQELWIGATDIFTKGRFTWTDAKPVIYTKLSKGNGTALAATKPREACISILADPHWGAWKGEYCIKKLPFVCKTKKCQGKSDLAFIVDASGSVTEAGFQKAKSFMFQVIRGFQVKNNQTHIGLIRFSTEADLIFGFKQYHGNLHLKKAIDNMEFSKGETETHKALDLARTSVFSQLGKSRRLVPKIALVMTDGKSKNPFKTSLAAKKLKEEGVTIVTLGIGNGVDRKELVSMASSVKDVLYVESYAALGAKVKDIRQRVCDEIVRVGLIQDKIRAQEERQRLAFEAKQRLVFEAKQRLEFERRRKLSQQQRKIENEKRRKLEAANRRREQVRRRQEQARKRQEQLRKRQQQTKRGQEQARRRQEMERKRKEQERKRKEQEMKRKAEEQKRLAQRNRNQQNRNTQNRNNRNQQNRNQQNRNQQNRFNQNRNVQNRNQQNRNQQNRYNQNRNVQNRNQQNRNQQNRNQQNRNQQNRNQQNRYNQNRNVQNRNQQNRQQQNRYNQNRYNQNRNVQNRNQQNRYNQNRYNQNRNVQNRNQQNRNPQYRNQQNRYNQNRNVRNRNQQNRYNQQNRNNRNLYQG